MNLFEGPFGVPDDVTLWYMDCKGICPHCGTDMKKLHPSMNIYPHFAGVCSELVKPISNLKSEKKS